MKLLFILMAATLAADAAGPSDPGKAAIDFLEKVRQRKLDLEPGGDTALSAQTAEKKRHQIARRLDRMARDLGSDPLEVGAVKLDENFAAVLVRKAGGFDPSRLQVFPVALVKRGAEWMVAPVPASFENAGAGYAISLRKRLELLENWMLREQVVDLEKLRAQTAARMRGKIEGSLSTKELRGYDPKRVGENFLSACERRDLPAVLGFLGGLSTPLPADWAIRLRAAEDAFDSSTRGKSPWRLLTAPEVARVLVHHEEKSNTGLISIACLDPSGGGAEGALPRIEELQFDLVKSGAGLWQINPPPEFLQESGEVPDDSDIDPDPELSAEFSEKWNAAHPASPLKTAERARQALVSALSEGTINPLLSLSKLDAGKDAIQAAQVWWEIHQPASILHPMPLAFNADETHAVAIVQLLSARNPEEWNPRSFHFEKSKAGWHWTPNPAMGAQEKFGVWVESELKRWPDLWQQSLLANSGRLGKIDGGQAPDKNVAIKIVTRWHETTRRGDPADALSLTARLESPRSDAIILQNFGYEVVAARRSVEKPVITGVYQGNTLTAVGVKIDHGAGKTTYPLYPVISTPLGPRILIEIDLFAAAKREFLNGVALDRLQPFLPAADSGELQALYSEHQASIEKTRP